MLAPLRARGFFWSMHCDEVEVRALVQLAACRRHTTPPQASHPAIYHPQTQLLHISGTPATYDALVWGATPQIRQENKQNDTPLVRVPVHSQLAAVTPYVMVPGPWSDEEVAHHVGQLVAALTDNNGCNQVI